MKTLNQKIGYFLITNTVWLFFTAIFFVSFNRIMTLQNPKTGERLVYLATEKWELYFLFASSALLLFLPVLLFSFFRNLLRRGLNKWLFRSLWAYCFVIHSVLMFHYNIDQFFPVLRIHVDTPVIFGISILLVELIIQLNDFFTNKIDITSQLKKVKIEKAILLLVVAVAFLFSFPPFNKSIVGHDDIVYYVGEIFLDFLKWLIR